MGIRRADKAGSWYSDEPDALALEIEVCLKNAAACGGAAARPHAVMVPHAGLAYSGTIAAAGFSLIRETFDAVDSFVVFGACHRAYLLKPAIWAAGSWDTPLGAIDIDEELASCFADSGAGTVNEAPHFGDNAIELLTPFIKFLYPKAKMVPIAVSAVRDSVRRGRIAAELARESGKRVVALASTDLTHYGASFGVLPAGTGAPALEWLRENDGRFLDAVLSLDGERIVETAERDGSACGAGAVAAACGWAVEQGASHARVLAYTNSYEVMPVGEAEHMVGYAAVSFE